MKETELLHNLHGQPGLSGLQICGIVLRGHIQIQGAALTGLQIDSVPEGQFQTGSVAVNLRIDVIFI